MHIICGNSAVCLNSFLKVKTALTFGTQLETYFAD